MANRSLFFADQGVDNVSLILGHVDILNADAIRVYPRDLAFKLEGKHFPCFRQGKAQGYFLVGFKRIACFNEDTAGTDVSNTTSIGPAP